MVYRKYQVSPTHAQGLVETFYSHEELVLKAGTSMESLGLKGDDEDRNEFLIRDEDEEVESNTCYIVHRAHYIIYFVPT